MDDLTSIEVTICANGYIVTSGFNNTLRDRAQSMQNVYVFSTFQALMDWQFENLKVPKDFMGLERMKEKDETRT